MFRQGARSTLVATSTVVALLLSGTGAAHAASGSGVDQSTSEPTAYRSASQDEKAPPLTAEQDAFVRDELGPEALAYLTPWSASTRLPPSGQQTQVFPVAAVAIAAAAWCARGAVSSVPTSVLSDIADGRQTRASEYARNAIIGCVGGQIGGWAWRVLPGWVKTKTVALVASFIIRYIR